MQKQIKKQIAALKLQACSTPADNCKEQIAALKLHFGVKTLKQLYHCLENELTNGMFAALKKASVVIFLIGLSFQSIAQSWAIPSKKDFYAYGCMAISGIAKGYNQAIIHHHFGEGSKFWDKTISWENKYKNYPADQSAAFIGSKGIFVMFTDGQHLTQAINTTALVAGTGLSVWDIKQELKEIPKGQKFLYIIWRKIILPFGIRTAAFELTFKNL